MSSLRLSPTSYVVLGMIALRGPTTPYQLKRAVGRSVGYFWRFPHTQLYEEPVRLATARLLTVRQEANGRRRRVYTITRTGRDALRRWLRLPVGEHFQLRDVAELKLFFGEVVETADLVALAREQVATHERRLSEYEKIQQRFAGRPELANRMAPLDLGLLLERAALAFWRRIVASPPSREHEQGREPRHNGARTTGSKLGRLSQQGSVATTHDRKPSARVSRDARHRE